jgi:Flp pilus assembly protein TadG
MNKSLKNERGAAMVEAPLCIVIVLLLSMGILTLTQVVWTHMDLASAARDGARYAGRTEWDPSATPVTLERHRTIDQIKAFAAEAASESGVGEAEVFVTVVRDGALVTPLPSEPLHYGDQVTVEIRNYVSNSLYQTAASITNGMAGIFHLGDAFNEDGVHIKSVSTSYVE